MTIPVTTKRVKHSVPAARWPSREAAAAAWLFSPLRIGHRVVAEGRAWVTAMVPWRATEDGFVTPEVIDWYARFAAGRPGVLVVEATGIRDIRSGPLLRNGTAVKSGKGSPVIEAQAAVVRGRRLPASRCVTGQLARRSFTNEPG